MLEDLLPPLPSLELAAERRRQTLAGGTHNIADQPSPSVIADLFPGGRPVGAHPGQTVGMPAMVDGGRAASVGRGVAVDVHADRPDARQTAGPVRNFYPANGQRRNRKTKDVFPDRRVVDAPAPYGLSPTISGDSGGPYGGVAVDVYPDRRSYPGATADADEEAAARALPSLPPLPVL